MTKCLQCESERVTKGNIVDPRNGGPVEFHPEGLRLFAFTLSRGPEMADRAHACLDCGLVWSTTDKAELAGFVRKHCDS